MKTFYRKNKSGKKSNVKTKRVTIKNFGGVGPNDTPINIYTNSTVIRGTIESLQFLNGVMNIKIYNDTLSGLQSPIPPIPPVRRQPMTQGQPQTLTGGPGAGNPNWTNSTQTSSGVPGRVVPQLAPNVLVPPPEPLLGTTAGSVPPGSRAQYTDRQKFIQQNAQQNTQQKTQQDTQTRPQQTGLGSDGRSIGLPPLDPRLMGWPGTTPPNK